MLDITNDIQSLTTFRRRSGDFMKQLKKTKRPVVLTVKGKAAAIVQDAEAYRRLLDIAARADAVEGIRQGLEQARQGKVRPARDFISSRSPGSDSTSISSKLKFFIPSRLRARWQYGHQPVAYMTMRGWVTSRPCRPRP